MRRVEKPWGHELIWAETEGYVAKIVHIRRGGRLPLQYHRQRDESLMVRSGRVRLAFFRDGEQPQTRELAADEAFHVTPELRHSMEAVEDSELLLVSTTEVDDVVRLQGGEPGGQGEAGGA